MSARFGRRAFLASTALSVAANAMGRTPYGGTVAIEVPLSLDFIDPHAGDHAASALFASALADTLYASDAAGRPYPALAADLPERSSDGARFALRPGLVTAHGHPLDSSDIVASLERSRRFGGRPVLGGFGNPRRDPKDALAVLVPGCTPDALARALVSPLTAIVPPSFSAREPDGTGAFRATRTEHGFVFERNDRAARGPAYLDSIRLEGSADLATTLRAFESGDTDVGWLGAGLHRRRPGAVDFHTSSLGFIVLRTGPEAGQWAAPGVAAALVEGMDPARFAYLGLAPLGAGKRTLAPWGGKPAAIYVDGASPFLVEVARVVSAVLSVPGHELTVSGVAHTELAKRREQGKFSLSIEVVRSLGPGPELELITLLNAAVPNLAETAPHLAGSEIANVTRSLPFAILGDFAVSGARAPDIHGLESWDLGAVFRQ
jgi:peptide/nickel transport system substrate-binding protein